MDTTSCDGVSLRVHVVVHLSGHTDITTAQTIVKSGIPFVETSLHSNKVHVSRHIQQLKGLDSTVPSIRAHHKDLCLLLVWEAGLHLVQPLWVDLVLNDLLASLRAVLVLDKVQGDMDGTPFQFDRSTILALILTTDIQDVIVIEGPQDTSLLRVSDSLLREVFQNVLLEAWIVPPREGHVLRGHFSHISGLGTHMHWCKVSRLDVACLEEETSSSEQCSCEEGTTHGKAGRSCLFAVNRSAGLRG
mmetsp:Transcript_21776/g.34577  ORF Transcript_21776/g.34577 Transcript_21776/m.34577 type:complete len:246 (-) Transcript_21776:271-1008(-)